MSGNQCGAAWVRLGRRWTAGLSLALLGAASSVASGPAPAEPIPAERFFQHPSVLQVELSPSGRYLAMSAVRDDQHASLFVVDLQSQDPAKVVATYTRLDVVRFSWVSDQRLVYAVGLLEPGKQQGYGPGLFGVDSDGSHHVELLCSDQKSCYRLGQRDAVFTRLLAVPQPEAGNTPREIIVGRFKQGRHLHLVPLWMDTRSGITREFPIPDAPDDVTAWWFDPSGQPRLAMHDDNDDAKVSYYWHGPGDTGWRRIAEFEALHPAFVPVGVTSDGRLFVTQSRGPAREAVLTTFDFKALAPAPQATVQAPGFDFRGELVTDDTDGSLLGVRVDTDAASTVWFSEPMKQLQAMVDKRLPGRVNHIRCRRCNAADVVALVTTWSDRDPGRLLLYRGATQRFENVATLVPGIEPKRMATVELQRIPARDGRDLPVWLTRPPGLEAGKPLPAVVMVHGGPWVRGNHWQWEAMAQFLASRGYLVIEPEFRGSDGYGDAHLHAGDKQWGQAMQDDVTDALRWARKQGLANDRACIAGASYGGYSALMGLVRDPALYRCGIAWVATADPVLFVKGSAWVSDDISNWGRRFVLPELVGDPEKDAAMLNAVSPVAQAARIKAPLLLGYGGEDLRVPVEHGERLRAAMIQAGNPPEWVVYDHEGHGWQRIANRVDWANRMEAFLQKHLRDEAR